MRNLLLTILLLGGPVIADSPSTESSDNPTPQAPEQTNEATSTSPTPVVDGEGDVEATDYGTFNLNARDIELTQILEMLSEVSHRNILAGRDVTATVSVNLYDVTFDEALTAVLEVAGCAAIDEGNFAGASRCIGGNCLIGPSLP